MSHLQPTKRCWACAAVTHHSMHHEGTDTLADCMGTHPISNENTSPRRSYPRAVSLETLLTCFLTLPHSPSHPPPTLPLLTSHALADGVADADACHLRLVQQGEGSLHQLVAAGRHGGGKKRWSKAGAKDWGDKILTIVADNMTGTPLGGPMISTATTQDCSMTHCVVAD